jgi:hypothetical protein
MADTPNGETVVVEPPKNDATTPATPPLEDKSPEPSEVDKLQKQLDQERMEKNLLRNKLEAEEKAKAEAKDKELAEQNKFKDLYEQTQAKLAEKEAAEDKAARDAELKAESDKVFAEFPEQVKALAEEAGMNLADTDEETVTAFKAKLEKISGLVVQPKVTPNNPGTTPVVASELSPQQLHETLSDPVKFEAYIKKNHPGMASMTKPVAQ